MKKVVFGLKWLLFVLTIFFPVGTLLCWWFDYKFELISVFGFAVAIAVLSVLLVVFELVFKEKIENDVTQVLWAISTPLSLINAVFYIGAYSRIWVIVCTLISVGCCCFLSVKNGKPLALKITSWVISGLMLFPVGIFSIFALLLGDVGQNTVMQTLESSNGEYYAQVIDNDQGALGGATLVDVYKNCGINLILFKIEKEPQRIYYGRWGEFEDMQIYWKDDHCLVINSVEYEIE